MHPVFNPFYWDTFLTVVERGLREGGRLMLIIDHPMDRSVYRNLEISLDQYLTGLPGINWSPSLLIRTPTDCTPQEMANLNGHLQMGIIIIDPATLMSITQSGAKLSQCTSGNRVVLHRNGICTLYRCQ